MGISNIGTAETIVRTHQVDVVNRAAIHLHVPEWYSDQEFIEWLNSPNSNPMTWHCKGEPVSEWSDVLVFVDPSLNGEGSDSDMPKKYWDAIVAVCRQKNLLPQKDHIPVRLMNLDYPPSINLNAH